MEENSIDDTSYTLDDDGSSHRTFSTPQSMDPSSAAGGMARRPAVGFFDRLEYACKTSLDALWWLFMENTSPEEKRLRSITPKAKAVHRLRIVDSAGQESNPYHTDQSSQTYQEPIRWKINTSEGSSSASKGNGCVTHIRNIRDSTGGKLQQHINLPGLTTNTTGTVPRSTVGTEDIHENIGTADGFPLSAIKEIKTVDSRIVQRKRLLRKQGQRLDEIRFLNPSNPETIICKSHPHSDEEFRGGQRKQHSYKKQQSGLPPLAPIPKIMKPYDSSAKDLSPDDIVKPNSVEIDHRVITTKDGSFYLGQNRCESKTRQREKCSDNRAAVKSFTKLKNNHNSKTPSRSRFIEDLSRRSQGLDGMTIQGSKTGIMERENSFHAPRMKKVTKRECNSVNRDKVLSEPWTDEESRDEEEEFFRQIDEMHVQDSPIDKSGSYKRNVTSSGSISQDASSRGIQSEAAYRSPQRLLVPKVHSPSSVRSLNSARCDKESWIRSRPSFDLTDIPRGAMKSEEYVGRAQSKHLRKTKSRTGMYQRDSVASLDRKMRNVRTRIRNEDGTMSVL